LRQIQTVKEIHACRKIVLDSPCDSSQVRNCEAFALLTTGAAIDGAGREEGSSMYVCICRNFNERQVRDAAKTCGTVGEIFRVLGGRPSCGKCIGAVRDIASDVTGSNHSMTCEAASG
jgi:bacterioferritin-associated ferredoxin